VMLMPRRSGSGHHHHCHNRHSKNSIMTVMIWDGVLYDVYTHVLRLRHSHEYVVRQQRTVGDDGTDSSSSERRRMLLDWSRSSMVWWMIGCVRRV
jgi:hypothetical protein